jgi:hypothetical protein
VGDVLFFLLSGVAYPVALFHYGLPPIHMLKVCTLSTNYRETTIMMP